MKSILTLLLLFSSMLYAKWMPYPINEAIKDAEIIVIANYIEEVKENKAGEGYKRQVVKFNTHHILKGHIEDTFYVNGMMTGNCVPEVYFHTEDVGKTFILFLSKDPLSVYNRIFFHQTYTPISEYAFQFDASLYKTTNQKMTIQKLKILLNKN